MKKFKIITLLLIFSLIFFTRDYIFLNKIERAEKNIRNAENEMARYYGLSELAAAYATEDLNLSMKNDILKNINELLTLQEKIDKDWNWGNVVHHSNIALGRLKLLEGDVKAADDYLFKAGTTIGSPQLNNFGPNMKLAEELLHHKDQQTTVQTYFMACRLFWKNAEAYVPKWTQEIDQGKIPDFKKFLYY